MTMTSPAKHSHSIYVDAPVEMVFSYISDPLHFIEAMPPENRATLGEVDRLPSGEVVGYECRFHELGLQLTAQFTRNEFVPDQRIVDHSSMGVLFTTTVEPAPTGVASSTGTTLTYSWDATGVMRMIDAAFFHGDDHIEAALKKWKREIESPTS